MRLLLLACILFSSLCIKAQNYYLFAGTYTFGKSKGIYVYQFNSNTGDIQWISNTDSSSNPSFIALSPNGNYLYAANETGKENPGHVTAYSFNKENGKLTFLNQQRSGGDAPCFVTTDKSGKWAVTANYSGGSLSAFPINTNGSLQHYSQLIQHKGKSINSERQEKAHVHSIFFTPDYKYILSPDLGMDKTMIYTFNASLHKPLHAASIPFIKSTPGSGPRHIAFHPNHKFVYIIEELSGTIKTCSYKNGVLKQMQTIATHPADYKGQSGAADIHISPDGKFLYASNRGDENNIAIFSINVINGKLTNIGYQPSGGIKPRNFIIDPSGRFLLVANQNTNNIVVFKRDMQSGLLQQTTQQIEVPDPACLQLLEKN